MSADVSTSAEVGIEVSEDLDLDGDSILNDRDNCAKTSNPDQLNYDKDALGDACDPTPGEPPIELGCTVGEPKPQQSTSWGLLAAALAIACGLRFRRKKLRAKRQSP